MLTLSEARTKAEEILPLIRAQFKWDDIEFVEKYTREQEKGWTFLFNTRLSQETGRPQDGLVGNGPVFVDKYSGATFLLPSGGWKRWLQVYESTGDLQGREPVAASPGES